MTANRFDLGELLDELAYDFTTGPGGWDDRNGPGKGVIPEPTDASIRKFRLAVAPILRVAPEEPTEDLVEKMKADVERSQEDYGAMCRALAELCQGHPNAKELAALPVRAFRAFNGWVIGKLGETVPTQPASDLNGSLAPSLSG